MSYPSEKQVEAMKKKYPEGTRIRLNEMEDPYAPIPSGTEGKVLFVDDMGQLHMKWDNGRGLALNPFVDEFETISAPISEEVEEQVEKGMGGMKL